MLHDIQYMQTAEGDANKVDDLAINNAGWDLPGLATKVGLTFRKRLGLIFNPKLDMLTKDETHLVGDQAMTLATTQEPYRSLFGKYNVNILDYKSNPRY